MTNRPRLAFTQTLRLALNTSLHASISVLRADAAGLTRFLEEQASENPHLVLSPPPPPQDWLPRWSGALAPTLLGDQPEPANAAPSLIAHVLDQVERLNLPPSESRIALALIEALEPSGWLGEPIAAIASRASAPQAQTVAMLKRLQAFDPVGIFARNLAECLALQAAEAEVLDDAMVQVLQNLPLLAAGDMARLAEACGHPEAKMQACLAHIRAMNPKPGAGFQHDSPALQRAPDLLVRGDGIGWQIELNHSSLPSLRIDDTGPSAGLTAARNLERMVEARNTTLLTVGREIVSRQQEALRLGLIALAPMTMADLAEALGFHESTISRVVAGTSVDTPHGTWWLREMFSPAMGGNGAPLVAAAALRHRLSRLIGAEAPAQPLSDAALVEALTAETGVTLARRTVAKYRETLGIPAASRRKRQMLPPLGKKRRSKG